MCERKGADGTGPELRWWILGGWLAGWLAGKQASWLLDRLAGWLCGRAPGWSALGCMTGWPVGCLPARYHTFLCLQSNRKSGRAVRERDIERY